MTPEPIRDTIVIHAPLDRCWRLSTRVELVQKTLGMHPVGGTSSGFIEDGSRVVWRGWKFGLPTKHHTLITGFSAPHPAAVEPTLGLELHAERPDQPVAWFQDRQERGRFAFFQHDHWLRERTAADGSVETQLEDEVHFRLPFGVLGRLAARWLMAPHIRGLVKRRFASIKELAEGEGWREWV